MQQPSGYMSHQWERVCEAEEEEEAEEGAEKEGNHAPPNCGMHKSLTACDEYGT